MHDGKHGNDVGTLKPTTVCLEQVKDIPQVDAGVEGVWVSETLNPSVFDNLEDEGPASHLTGSDERLGGKLGGPLTPHFFTESVSGVFFDAGVVLFVGANHAVKDHGVLSERL